ncbi:L,D-transpeptidase family protein [Sphingomonas sp. ID0503]|uniref:L,D-transpeptidase family protein n=1 Tax=Sphingomonas sp. ID0503 TaxID=3399691 RepID=UPI003AFAA6BE
MKRSLYLAAAIALTSPAIASAAVDLKLLKVQVLLDRAGFAPGVIDGKGGQSLTAALRGFQEARGLSVTGKPDAATLNALGANKPFPATRRIAIGKADAAGPFAPVPKEPADQAKMSSLGYAALSEKLAERFHTTPATLAALNPAGTRLRAGAVVNFPNVLPASRAYDAKLKDDWKATLSSLNVSASQPEAEKVVVDKSEGVLKVYGKGGKLVAQFPATMGSEHDPLPIGSWTIKGASYNPTFHYNPDLFWDAKSSDEKAKLPAGPNSPVGVVWLDLSKEHYGIHGTPNPEKIGRTESHGCIRLANWDAARLSLMVKPGTPAIFQE